ncbi:hypothetical protein EJ997_03085 [Flaviflexus ciconiae]|uniref:Uncharacterized protein n=1 Tax=Flaviflexus ciconiae TaxID=2496867 RepID=A0A3S9PVW5_9ACTO|nr:hypothetical protein [Flaviflexus ciconiae]AZQ76474.1 hypothetical protein EJ997_03085 [Flaviflexus ciconiae]
MDDTELTVSQLGIIQSLNHQHHRSHAQRDFAPSIHWTSIIVAVIVAIAVFIAWKSIPSTIDTPAQDR